jgi:hypothetical protein
MVVGIKAQFIKVVPATGTVVAPRIRRRHARLHKPSCLLEFQQNQKSPKRDFLIITMRRSVLRHGRVGRFGNLDYNAVDDAWVRSQMISRRLPKGVTWAHEVLFAAVRKGNQGAEA